MVKNRNDANTAGMPKVTQTQAHIQQWAHCLVNVTTAQSVECETTTQALRHSNWHIYLMS